MYCELSVAMPLEVIHFSIGLMLDFFFIFFFYSNTIIKSIEKCMTSGCNAMLTMNRKYGFSL